MLRYSLAALAALVLLTASLIPDDAEARARGGGYRGGGGAYRGGAVAVRGPRGYGGAAAVGAAAVGAAAVGAAAAGAYRGGCGYDAYGNWVCY
jgi:hypothetical protein